MQLITRLLALFALILFITACTSEEQPSTDIKEDQWQKQQEELGQQFNAMMNWEDDFEYQVTLKAQKSLKGKVVLFKNYNLTDVFEQKGKYFAKFESYDGYSLILETSLESEVTKRLLANELDYNDYAVVAYVDSISVPQFALDPQIVDGDYVEVEVSTNATKIVRGNLLDFIVEE